MWPSDIQLLVLTLILQDQQWTLQLIQQCLVIPRRDAAKAIVSACIKELPAHPQWQHIGLRYRNYSEPKIPEPGPAMNLLHATHLHRTSAWNKGRAVSIQ